jgi:thiol:disulfide interchange protein DsbC
MSRRSGIAIVVAILCLSLFLCRSDPARGANSQKQELVKCEVLNEKEARAILDSLRLNEAKILKIQNSPIQQLWEIALENRGNRFLIYVDCSKTYVMPGPIIEYRTGMDRTRQRVEELNRDKRVNLTGLRLDEALVMGDKNASIRVITFFDLDCGFCKKLHQEMKKLLEKRRDIAFFLKVAPIHKNPEVEKKSKDIVCGKSVKNLDEAFEGKPIPTNECQTKELEDNTKFMEANGFNGVPVTLFPDGSIQVGFVDSSVLEKRIDEAARAVKNDVAKRARDGKGR